MTMPRCEREIFISGPVGRLEARVSEPAAPPRAVAVICHPHPLHGGTLHNKVVHTFARSLTTLGVVCVRFNFRGVGESEGSFGEGLGEADDCAAVANWLQPQFPGTPLWLGGFSFGAGVALRAAQRLHPAQLVLVAPSVNLHGFGEVDTASPTLLIQGTADEIVPPAAVQAWQREKAPQAQVRVLPGVGHFFHGALNTLKGVLTETLA